MFRDSFNLRGTRHLHVHYPTEVWGSGYCTMPAVPLVSSKQCDLPSTVVYLYAIILPPALSDSFSWVMFAANQQSSGSQIFDFNRPPEGNI